MHSFYLDFTKFKAMISICPTVQRIFPFHERFYYPCFDFEVLMLRFFERVATSKKKIIKKN